VIVAAESEWVQAWRPDLPGVSEAFHAHFVDHEYPPHSHDTWTVIVVDSGAISYDLERRHRAGDASTVTVLPPHTIHDGKAATDSGFTKRVLYLDTTVLPEHLIGRSVDQSAIADDQLRDQLATMHDILRQRDDAIKGEECLDAIGTRLRHHLRSPTQRMVTPSRPERSDAVSLRAYLEAGVDGPVTLRDASATLGRSVAHLSRSFRSTYGVAPHAFVVSLRVERARRLLLDGWPPSLAATAAGFYDQAHLNRHFVRHTGTTPGRFGRTANR
jgi:AraC-like DNA-binding protein